MPFIGRDLYLARLARILTDVTYSREGRFVLVRGRRRVGKSRLVEEFIEREGARGIFFAASRQTPARELELFRETLSQSGLPHLSGALPKFPNWEAALTYVASIAKPETPIVLVLDELPYLIEDDPSLEATLQKTWDRTLSRAPVLLIGIGSDLAMMAALTAHRRPLFGRPTSEIVLPPLSPLELSGLIGLEAAEAFDAYLVVGGFPTLAQSWRQGATLWEYLDGALQDPSSPLVVDGERIVAAEFPGDLQARRVLTAIGSGQTTFSKIGRVAGVGQSSLQRALDTLTNEKRVVASVVPMSPGPSRERRYYVADPYLRFWLRFIGPTSNEIERGRGRMVVERLRRSWPSYRGKAIEPIVREAIDRLLPDPRFGDGRHTGGYWTRSGSQELDVAIGDDSPEPTYLTSVGSIKWREDRPFDERDRDELIATSAGVPGVTRATTLVGVSRAGFATKGLSVQLGPDDLLRSWEGDDVG